MSTLDPHRGTPDRVRPTDPGARADARDMARAGVISKEALVFAKDAGLLQGTVELLVLKTLSWGPMHGYGIAAWIEGATEDVLRVEEGSLYPALYRMARKGWIRGEWGVSENNRRAKYYHLTAAGRQQLVEQVQGWQRLAQAVSAAVAATQPPAWAS